MTDLERIINGELVREACSRAMFCPLCGVTLDCDDAVYVSGPKGSFVLDGKCFDKKAQGRTAQHGYEIIDGRDL